jgi:hypothetical protein
VITKTYSINHDELVSRQEPLSDAINWGISGSVPENTEQVGYMPSDGSGKGRDLAKQINDLPNPLTDAENSSIRKLIEINNSKFSIYIISSRNTIQNYLDNNALKQSTILTEVRTTRDAVRDYLIQSNFIATTHEDIPSTRNICPKADCQFWKLDLLSSYNRIGDLYAHESMHNVQASNNNRLHNDIWGSNEGATNPQQAPDNKAFQAIIEGYADIYGCGDGGCTPSYHSFRSFYKAMSGWAAQNDSVPLFNNVEKGSFNSYITLKNKYESITGKGISQLLSDSGIR